MKTQELAEILEEKGFRKDKQNSGYNYTLCIDHIDLICYIEPEVSVEFVSVYKWSNNKVKGTYSLSVKELAMTKDSIPTLFRKTKENMPREIGLEVDSHLELEKVIDKVFD